VRGLKNVEIFLPISVKKQEFEIIQLRSAALIKLTASRNIQWGKGKETKRANLSSALFFLEKLAGQVFH
jgi:hypothetical protein